MKTKNMTTSQLRNLVNRSPLRRGFFLIPLVFVCFAFSPRAQAKEKPDGDVGLFSTAEGTGALFSLTDGIENTAIGFQALYSNTFGSFNTASGAYALSDNTIGFDNTANGDIALASNTTGGGNTATGFEALLGNKTGGDNTATGSAALISNTTGGGNTANGVAALFHNNGSDNIALGYLAGMNLTTGDNNIAIGNEGVAAEANTIRVGTQGTQTNAYIAGIFPVSVPNGLGVVVDSTGHLGTVASSQRFKDAIKPMDKASEAILALKPVTFHYKKELDPEGIPQFGLVAEEVEKVNPDLVARDADGKVYTVRYEAVNAMLLNEFLKEHRKVEQQETTITQLKSRAAKQDAIAAQQQEEIKALTASLKEQASQIQKVSDQLEVSKPAPRTVLNDQ
jgi:hypothetical protein